MDSDRHLVYLFFRNGLKGHFNDKWAAWFDGLTITREDNGDTLLTLSVVVHAVRALARSGRITWHGLHRKAHDLGMPSVSVIQVDPKP